MRYTMTALATAATFAAAPAFAGNLDTPAPAPAVQPMQQPVPMGIDWTGGYVGGQLGYGDVDTDAGVSGDGAIGGEGGFSPPARATRGRRVFRPCAKV